MKKIMLLLVLATLLVSATAWGQSGIRDQQVSSEAAIKGSKIEYPTFSTVTDGSVPTAATYFNNTKRALKIGDIIRKTGTAEYFKCTSLSGPAWKPLAGATSDGTAALPAYSFASDPNTGMYWIGADNLGVSTNGVLRLDVSTTYVSSSLPVAHAIGTSAAPSLTFTGDVDTGISAQVANTLVLSAGGAANTLTLGTGLLTSTELLALPVGAVGAPSVYFGTATTGLYSAAATSVDVATTGALRLTVADAAVTSTVPVVLPAGAVGAPALTWTGDLDTGAYYVGANAFSLVSNGAAVANITAATLTIPTGVDLAIAAGGDLTIADAPTAGTDATNKTYVDNALLFGTQLTIPAGVQVNLGAIAVTALYTCPAGRTCVIEKVVFRSASQNVNQAAVATYNIGWQAVASGVVASVALVNPTATTTSWHPVVVGVGSAAEQTVGAAAEVLNFNVTAACTTNPTTIRVDVFGYSY